MRYSFLVASFGAVACLLSGGCGRGAAPPTAKTNGPALAEVKLTIGEPIQVKNLTVYPILSSAARDADRFITLDEGLRAGAVQVSELSGRGARPRNRPADDQDDARAPADPLADDPFNPAAPGAADVEAASTTDQAETDAEQEPTAKPNSTAAAADQNESAPNADGLPDELFQPDKLADAQQDDAQPDEAMDDPFADQSDAELTGSELNRENPSACPDVNRVVVVNRSDRPLYLMPGETIVGGLQDRVLAEETIIPPDGKPVTVAVFCVEHGRWMARDNDDTVQLAASYTNNLSLVVGESFASGKASLGKSARLAVQDDKQQGRVWDEVAKVNDQAKTDSATGAFTSNFRGEQVRPDLKQYMDGLENPIADCERIVGVVVAINGKVESMDVFESTPLFRKLWPKLIKGHALDAANLADAGDPSEVEKPCPLADAQRLYDTATAGEVATKKAKGALVMTGRESQGVVSFSVNEKSQPSSEPAAASTRGMMGGMGGVHTSGFSK